jgi:hypothetical protein
MSLTKQFITPQSTTTNQSYSSCGEEISSQKLNLLKHRIKVLELYFVGNDNKREKKRKADSLAHFFNDDKEASYLVSRLNMDMPWGR